MTATKIVFSHYPCIDGAASAWALKAAFPDAKVHCQGIDHNPSNNFIYRTGGYERFEPVDGHNDRQVIERTLEDIRGSKEIYFIDYVPNDTAIIGELLQQGHKVRIFDHHDTARANLATLVSQHQDNPDFSVVFDRYKSGARITWDTLHPDTEAPELLKLIEKMDLLAFKNDKERKACCYIDGYLNSPDQQENIYTFCALVDEFRRGGLEGMALKGEAEYTSWKKWRDHVISSARVIALGNQKVTIVPAGDIMAPPRGVLQELIQYLTRAGEPPVLLMVNQTRERTVVNVRVRPEDSEITPHVIEYIKGLDEDGCISGGGRGAKGLIGQGVCRMPHDVAERLGIIERQWTASVDRPQHRQAGR